MQKNNFFQTDPYKLSFFPYKYDLYLYLSKLKFFVQFSYESEICHESDLLKFHAS